VCVRREEEREREKRRRRRRKGKEEGGEERKREEKRRLESKKLRKTEYREPGDRNSETRGRQKSIVCVYESGKRITETQRERNRCQSVNREIQKKTPRKGRDTKGPSYVDGGRGMRQNPGRDHQRDVGIGARSRSMLTFVANLPWASLILLH
jgi:hypothetical protein